MKQYTKHYGKTSNGINTLSSDVQKTVSVEGTDVRKAVGRTAPTAFLTAGSTKTHVLTSEWNEWKESYLENAFKEWESWLTDYRLRSQARPYNEPFTLTDFKNHGL